MSSVKELLERAREACYDIRGCSNASHCDKCMARIDRLHDELTDALSLLKSEGEWVSDRMPQESQPVQVDIGDNCIHVAHLNGTRWVEWVPAHSAQPILALTVKRWRALPSPPVSTTPDAEVEP